MRVALEYFANFNFDKAESELHEGEHVYDFDDLVMNTVSVNIGGLTHNKFEKFKDFSIELANAGGMNDSSDGKISRFESPLSTISDS